MLSILAANSTNPDAMLHSDHSVNTFSESTFVRSSCDGPHNKNTVSIRFCIYKVTAWVRCDIVLKTEVHRIQTKDDSVLTKSL